MHIDTRGRLGVSLLLFVTLGCGGPVATPDGGEADAGGTNDAGARDAAADPDGGTTPPAFTGCRLPPEADGAPELPRETVDTTWVEPTGRTLTVEAGGDLQAAIDEAQGGDEIVLPAGATFTGHFELRDHGGEGYVVIRTDSEALPAPGQRVGPENAAAMATLETPDSLAVVTTDEGAHHYRFVGIHFRPAPGEDVNDLIILDHSSATDVAQLPHHIIFDRVWVQGDPTVGGKRGIRLNSAFTAVIDSRVDDWRRVGQDTQALLGWRGPGPFRIVNNYLAGAAENVMFGGADATIDGLVPSDIEICGNHFHKPLRWRVDDPSYEGTHWSIKNLLELKTGRRVLISGNVFENNWADAQTGFAFVIKSTNQSGGNPWVITEDVTIAYNVIRHSTSGINVARDDNTTNSIRVYGNLLYDLGVWGGPGRAFQVLGGIDDLQIEHNTLLASALQTQITFDGSDPSQRFVVRANVFGPARYGFHGSGSGVGNASLDDYTTDPVVTLNALVGQNESSYPEGNFFPATEDELGLLGGSGTDAFRLSESSPYATAAGGAPIGADLDILDEVLAEAL